MKPFTVIAYIVPDGGHYVETITAANATEAALQLRTQLGLEVEEFEIVGVAQGSVPFAPVEEGRIALAPYSAASP
jgi:hypothetical protein